MSEQTKERVLQDAPANVCAYAVIVGTAGIGLLKNPDEDFATTLRKIAEDYEYLDAQYAKGLTPQEVESKLTEVEAAFALVISDPGILGPLGIEENISVLPKLWRQIADGFEWFRERNKTGKAAVA